MPHSGESRLRAMPHSAESTHFREFLREFATICKNILTHWSVPKWDWFVKKTKGWKSCETLPLNYRYRINLCHRTNSQKSHLTLNYVQARNISTVPICYVSLMWMRTGTCKKIGTFVRRRSAVSNIGFLGARFSFPIWSSTGTALDFYLFSSSEIRNYNFTAASSKNN
jgi:hypothetical protein